MIGNWRGCTSVARGNQRERKSGRRRILYSIVTLNWIFVVAGRSSTVMFHLMIRLL